MLGTNSSDVRLRGENHLKLSSNQTSPALRRSGVDFGLALESACRILVGSLKGRRHLEDTSSPGTVRKFYIYIIFIYLPTAIGLMPGGSVYIK
jgi:hypothetical protein